MADPDPEVSVIVPCYNAAAWLGAAIESLLAQVPPPTEVIVIDDGSTDDSAAIAASFGAPVRAERQRNQGISAARNRGLSLATGAFVGFLDADDLWSETSLAARLQCLAGAPASDGVFGLVEAFVSPEVSATERQTLRVPAGAIAGRLLGACLFRRKVFARVGGFDPRFNVGETMDWFARADALGVMMARLDAVVLRRRVHSTNTTRDGERLKADYLRVLRASLARRRAAAEPEPEPMP
jgi:glycosyltransferase involved in cell wall biosynthesis